MVGKIILVALNIVSFVLFGVDKRRAINHRWRIPEKTLLLSALFGGGIGAFLGMQLFRHKTKHLSFKLSVPATMIIQIVAYSLYKYYFN